jgi:hypothetical protein
VGSSIAPSSDQWTAVRGGDAFGSGKASLSGVPPVTSPVGWLLRVAHEVRIKRLKGIWWMPWH